MANAEMLSNNDDDDDDTMLNEQKLRSGPSPIKTFLQALESGITWTVCWLTH